MCGGMEGGAGRVTETVPDWLARMRLEVALANLEKGKNPYSLVHILGK